MNEEECIVCGAVFVKSPRHKNQKYCRKPECQKAKKAAWQREKMRKDQEYRQNQKEYYAAWAKKNPDYWKEYRRRKPEKAKRNSLLQRVRYSRKKAKSVIINSKLDSLPVAKMDRSDSYPWPRGEFYLLPIIAKMNPSNLQLIEISAKSSDNFGYYLIAKMDSLGKS